MTLFPDRIYFSLFFNAPPEALGVWNQLGGYLDRKGVLQFIHAVEDAPMDRLQPVKQVRHRALQDDIAGVVQEPDPVEFIHRLDLNRRAVGQDWGVVFGSGLGGFLGHCRSGNGKGLRAGGEHRPRGSRRKAQGV